MERVDALRGIARRLRIFRGAVLATDVDGPLQKVVREAALALSCPVAAVSLLLERTAVIRASYGIDEPMVAAGGVDRDLTYCQFVVRDGVMFEVDDATTDRRLPTAVLDKFGIRAYLGTPVTIDGEIAGSLCVLDTQPRQFTGEQRQVLEELATLVSARLGELAAMQAGRDIRTDLFRAGSSATFGELRNLLGAMTLEVAEARIACREGIALARSVLANEPPDLSTLQGAAEAVVDVQKMLDGLDRCTARIVAQVVALEAAASSSDDCVTLHDAVEHAIQLSHHMLKLVGGVQPVVLPSVRLAASRSVAVLALASAFTEAASRCCGSHRSGLLLDGDVVEGAARVWIDVGDPRVAAEAKSSIARHIDGELDVRIVSAGARVGIELAT